LAGFEEHIIIMKSVGSQHQQSTTPETSAHCVYLRDVLVAICKKNRSPNEFDQKKQHDDHHARGSQYTKGKP